MYTIGEIREKVSRGLELLDADEVSTLPYILELLSVSDSGIDKIPMSAETRKDRIIEAVRRIALKGSQTRLLIMAFEDLHWIDKSSEDSLRDLFENISGARVFLIFTYRPEFVHTWGGKSYHNQVTLNRLSNRESLAMVAYLLSTENLDKDLEELVLEKTEGVPYFIEEFIKSLLEQKVIDKRRGRYSLVKDTEAMMVPSTVQDVLMARIDSLAESAKDVLQTGSVVGREFNQDLIQAVTGLSERELLSDLSVLKDAEFLYERGIYPQSSYIFIHALTQEVAYNSLLLKRRKEIHEVIGSAIESLHVQRLDELYEILAYHYSKSDNFEKAYQYLKLSGNKTTRNYSNWEAFRFYKEALEALNQLPDSLDNKRKQIEVILLMTGPMISLNYPEDSLRILEEGLHAASSINHLASLGVIETMFGMMFIIKGDGINAIKILNELKIKPWCAEGYLYLGEFYAGTGNREDALSNLTKAESMFQEIGMDNHLSRTQEILSRL